MNPTEPKSEQGAVRIKANSDQPFLVETGDSDFMMRSGRQIVEGCRLSIGVEAWLEEFQGFVGQVRSWIEHEGKSRVVHCLAAPQGARLVLYFIPETGRFDVDLAIELAELNAKLSRDFNIGSVEFIQIPEREQSRFLKPGTAIKVYG